MSPFSLRTCLCFLGNPSPACTQHGSNRGDVLVVVRHIASSPGQGTRLWDMVWRPGNEAMGHSVEAWERGYGTWCGGLGTRLWDMVWRPGNEAMGHSVKAWERGYGTWCGGLGMRLWDIV